MSAVRLIVGLGNPGAEYAQTRHNAGQWLVEALVHQHHECLRLESKFHGLTATLSLEENKVIALIPTTYMNHSGLAVSTVARFYKIAPEEILVAHDELDLAVGDIRLKKGGGHAGHNGLRDIINHLHSNDFSRLRIGIGHPGHKDKVTPFVLGSPSIQEKNAIETAIGEGIKILEG